MNGAVQIHKFWPHIRLLCIFKIPTSGPLPEEAQFIGLGRGHGVTLFPTSQVILHMQNGGNRCVKLITNSRNAAGPNRLQANKPVPLPLTGSHFACKMLAEVSAILPPLLFQNHHLSVLADHRGKEDHDQTAPRTDHQCKFRRTPVILSPLLTFYNGTSKLVPRQNSTMNPHLPATPPYRLSTFLYSRFMDTIPLLKISGLF